MEGVIGFITPYAANFAPRNWAFCQGQLINIASNTALFSIIGTYYGGNGTTTFALPNLAGKVIVGQGTLAGGSTYSIGEQGGNTTTALTTAQLPAHVHAVSYTASVNAAASADAASPGDAVYAAPSNGDPMYGPSPTATMKAYPGNISMQLVGSGVGFSIQDPVMAMNYLICLTGNYPARN